MLRKCAAGQGNLLLNIGPKGDGSVPERTYEILDRVGEWLQANADSIFTSERFEWSLRERGDARCDWNHHGRLSADGNNFYLHVRSWPGRQLRLSGVRCSVTGVRRLDTGERFPFRQDGELVVVDGLPERIDNTLPVVLHFSTKDRPELYKCGGYRVPSVPHCCYDPADSDMEDDSNA